MGAFYGVGEWNLHSSVRARFCMSQDQWSSLDEAAKEAHFDDFCKYRPTKPVKTTIKATDGDMEVNASAVNTKIKPRENHRVRNIRTQSKAGTSCKGNSGSAGPAQELDAMAAMTLKKLKEQYSNMAKGNTDEKNSTNEDMQEYNSNDLINQFLFLFLH